MSGYEFCVTGYSDNTGGENEIRPPNCAEGTKVPNTLENRENRVSLIQLQATLMLVTGLICGVAVEFI